jgi:hypothetical protein
MGAPYALSSDLVSAWPAKSLEVAQYIDGQLPLIAMTQNAQIGTTYQLAATDFTKLVTLSNASPVTVTVPLESSVAWVAGTQLRLMNLGAGLVTVAGAVGVTINGTPLTLAQYKNATLTKTGTNIWTFNGSSAAPGMDFVSSTSFSAVSSVSVNGCFTAAYDNYIVQCVALSSGSGTDLRVRLRSAGTDNTAANYDLQYGDVSSTTANGGRSTAQTGWVTAGALDTTYGLSTMTFGQPFLAASTVMTLFGGAPISSAYLRSSFNRHTASTSFDGFTMYVASGTTTGTLRVYGLRNS